MSDIKCVVCGEPWDAYGVQHGDMLPWEVPLFRAGAGCPACEGVPNGYTPATIFDLANGDDDELDRIHAAERVAEGTQPAWSRPSDPILWECDDCGVQAVTDLDTGDNIYRALYSSRASYERWHRNEDAPDEPEHTFEGGTRVCQKCYTTCAECGDPICPADNHGNGGGYPDPRGGYDDSDKVCSEDCLTAAEDEQAWEIWKNLSPRERVDYMFEHVSDFERCFSEYYDPLKRWRTILSNVRGASFSGSASELIY